MSVPPGVAGRVELRTDLPALKLRIDAESLQPPLTGRDPRHFRAAHAATRVFGCEQDSLRVGEPFGEGLADVIVTVPDEFSELGHVGFIARQRGTDGDDRKGKSGHW